MIGSLPRRAAAEGVGTAFLLMAVVGSGIMGERLAGGQAAMALLANALATGAVLGALIVAFGPISGAHFNPVVTVADATQGGLHRREAAAYVVAQLGGAGFGVVLAHAMFKLPLVSWSTHDRGGPAQALSEFIATFGLLAVVGSCSRQRSSAGAWAVPAYIVGAYWFTASTSFANPAVTLARAATDSFCGIRLADVPGFVVAQAAAAAAATALFRWLFPGLPREEALEPRDLRLRP